jgi:hypothetical protein
MRVSRAAGYAVVAVGLAVLPSAAQEARPVEVIPYVGLGTEAASPIGTAVTFPITSALSLETDVAYRRAEGNINALSSNATLLWFTPRIGRTSPYVAGGVGLEQYGAPLFSAAGGPPIATQGRLRMTINAGGGVKTPMNDKIDLRTDARWFKSLGKQGSEQFRVAQGIAFDVGKR